ncbi:MAG: NAD(P)/FAD-dependent oxidoreductase [Hyphomicrobiales bacterium]|nr:MAG: NAD(P)/FAD-dependent oxidoreductase [Hyphomicrobiales bacterium]
MFWRAWGDEVPSGTGARSRIESGRVMPSYIGIRRSFAKAKKPNPAPLAERGILRKVAPAGRLRRRGEHPLKIAVIGAGISGIAAARTLKRFGHEVVIFERTDSIGGIWATAYPGVTLQNTAETYRLSDFPWPFEVALHPTAAEVMRYLHAAAAHFDLDIRLSHPVEAMRAEPDGWSLTIASPSGSSTAHFDYAIIAVGHYSQARQEIALPGRETFGGEVVTADTIADLGIFDGKDVAIVGFGKTAVDMTMFALPRARRVTQIFRAARWLIPYRIMGKHMIDTVSPRSSTALEPSWVHPGRLAAFIHRRLGWMLGPYASGVEMMLLRDGGWRPGRTAEETARMQLVKPRDRLARQMRGSMAPSGYYDAVRSGAVEPVQGEIAGLDATGVNLKDGRHVAADMLVLALGHQRPDFPFLPEPYRAIMRSEPDGTPLYRHLLHPGIPRLAFAGFNHGLYHWPAVEVAMVWLGALLRGDIVLPSRDEMLASAARVHEWKRANTMFEPTRAYLISNRFHNYLDVLLGDLGVEPRRKSTLLAEINDAYGPADYAGVFEEYERARGVPRAALPLDT